MAGDSLAFITSITQDVLDSVAHNVWKVCPWRARNRQWLVVLLQAYFSCVFGGFLLACVLNSLEGNRWLDHTQRHRGRGATGKSALDECFWFVFTSMHGIAFQEFMPYGAAGRVIACAALSLGYWFIIFLCCIVMLSQLPGERAPSFFSTMSRMISAVWPSYVVFCLIIAATGSQCGQYVNEDYGYSSNLWPTGIYWMWQTAHRMPFGDLYPVGTFSHTLTVGMAALGLFYMPYAMALVAVRCPSMAQHEALLGELRKHPEESFGPGYVVPNEAISATGGNSTRETEMTSLTA